MEVRVVGEMGHINALYGLGLSYGLTSDYDSFEAGGELFEKIHKVAMKLTPKDGGHNKFLESICVWINVKASRAFWSQIDTYRCGITKQSESTMHTITKRQLTQDDFDLQIPPQTLDTLNGLIDAKDFESLKNELPEGFLQRRLICTNYKTLRNIIAQRKNHKLKQWKIFCKEVLSQLKHPEYFEDLK